MRTDCSQGSIVFQPKNRRLVVAEFNGGEITSDAGALLLREADLQARIIERAAECFDDWRDPERVRHSVQSMIRQRVLGLAVGYEDVNDHDFLRRDPMFQLLAGDNDNAPAGKATLNRLEVAASADRRNERYHKISFDAERFHALLRELFFEATQLADSPPPVELVLDIDATDMTLHGGQEGRFFHGYYRDYCYLPLYVFCGDHVLHAGLQLSSIDPAKGSVEALAPIVRAIRRRWPKTRIIVRGDSGFCREQLMAWCERRGVFYILGLAKNERLKAICGKRLERARRKHLATGETARLYQAFGYRTLKSWSRRRRVVAKCEHLSEAADEAKTPTSTLMAKPAMAKKPNKSKKLKKAGKPNPRFVVTNLLACEIGARDLYERGYCPRGEAEQRIGEQTELFADRVSCSAFASNQLRLSLSALAYALICRVRAALKGTRLERARPETLRSRLFKVGARIRASARRIVVSLATGYPWADLFRRCALSLQRAGPPGAL